MTDIRPGLNPARLLRLIDERIAGCQLDLSGTTVLTEAATGAYCVTPLIAARAGAKEVFAIARNSRFGSAAEAAGGTMDIARKAGVDGRIQIIETASVQVWGQADIVTNSGHLRPIRSQDIAHMKPTAVLPLMYETWEFRSSDVDVDACRKRGILVAGTNEQHAEVGVFEFLGAMAIKMLLDAGIGVFGSRILLICDNAFASYLESGLRGAGASVITSACFPKQILQPFDAVLLSTTPRAESALTSEDVQRLKRYAAGAVLLQFFGSLDRSLLRNTDIPVWPEQEPELGHMGILPSAIGPEPVVRLQTGGLKVGEVLLKTRLDGTDPSSAFVQQLF